MAIQPGSQWQLTAGPRYERIVETQQFVTALAGGRPSTFGRRYVFARLDRSTYATEFRVNYTFQPDLTLDFYAEPFAASGSYSGPGELAAARSRALRVYGRDDGTTTRPVADGGIEVGDGDATFVIRPRDFNVVSFRSNLVLRWEWRAGSTFYFVWQQNRAAEELAGTRADIGDMFNSLRASGDNFLAVKASFWIGR